VDISELEEKDKVYKDEEGLNYTVTGMYVLLYRYKAPFILHFYLPSGMFVLLSWLSFIIPYNQGERTGMLVTLILVMVSMYLAVVAASPPGLFRLIGKFLPISALCKVVAFFCFMTRIINRFMLDLSLAGN